MKMISSLNDGRPTSRRVVVPVLALVAGALVSASASAATLVDFELTLDTAVDGGSSYRQFHASEAGVGSQFAIGFQVTLQAVDGVAVDTSPIAAFCSEIQEPISAESYTFEARHLDELAAGQAAVSGTASAAIPAGGIGELRAARLAYLFDQHYTSDVLAAWTMTTAEPTLHAFQLAVWEVTHDSDLDLFDSFGEVYVGAQNNTLRSNALNLAQDYLDEVASAGLSADYVSSQFAFWALTSASGNGVDGNPGFQDVILATEIGSDNEQELKPLLPTPEPGPVVLVAGGLGYLLLQRQRRRCWRPA